MPKFEFGGFPGKVLGPGGRIRQLVAAREAKGASDQGPSADQENLNKKRHRAAALAKLTGGELRSSPANETPVDTMKRQGNDGSDADNKRMARHPLIAARRLTPMYPEGKVPAKPLALKSEAKSKRLGVIVVDTTKPGQPRPREIDIADKVSSNRAGQTSPQMRQYDERIRGGRAS
jgi:hypothetical protein